MKLEFSRDTESLDDLGPDWDDQPEEDIAERRIRQIEDLRLHRLRDIASCQIEWDVEGIIPRKSLCLISGLPGSGKSTFASALGYAVSQGEPFLGRPTSKRPVLILDRENPDHFVHDRFSRLRIEEHDDFMIFGQWIGAEPPAAGAAIIQEWVDRCEPKPLIVIDSFIAFHVGNENDAHSVRAHIKAYRVLAAMGATLLILHHPGKSETSTDYRGSSDIEAGVDIAYKITNTDDGVMLSKLELRAFKQRISVTSPLHFKYEHGQFVTDHRETSGTKPEQQLVELLKRNPGISGQQFERLADTGGLGRNKARNFLKAGVKSFTIRVESDGNRRAHCWCGPEEMA